MTFTFSATAEERAGYASAVLAYAAWGLYPLFFKQLDAFGVGEILAHRVLWSCVILLLIFTALSRLRAALRGARVAGGLTGALLAALFLSINWGCFIYAVNAGRVLESSLGYFLIPVVNAIFGVIFFGERLNRLKIAAVAVACGGIVAAFAVAGIMPWISLSIALSFGAYGMMRKRSRLDSATGLFLETLLLCPFALAFLCFPGAPVTSPFALTALGAGLLVLSGVITLVPLFTMVAAARRIEYNTLGFLQYITPIGHFLIAVLVYGEAVSPGYAIAFVTAWISIPLFLFGLMRPAPGVQSHS